MIATVVIGFRDRGRDYRRVANLARVLQHWRGCGYPVVLTSDGRTGDAQFNRSAAYNRGAAHGDVVVYAEADMLVPHKQIREAVALAVDSPGLVVPFTSYHYLSDSDSRDVRSGLPVEDCIAESVRDHGVSTGAVGVVSRATLTAVGRWDEAFEGSWYDDTAMRRAFELAAGPTRWVDGPGYHLYHLPGWVGAHLTDADRAATAANKDRLALYERAATAADIRALTTGAA